MKGYVVGKIKKNKLLIWIVHCYSSHVVRIVSVGQEKFTQFQNRVQQIEHITLTVSVFLELYCISSTHTFRTMFLSKKENFFDFGNYTSW